MMGVHVCIYVCFYVFGCMCACRAYAWRPDVDFGISLDDCPLYSLSCSLSLDPALTHEASLANQLALHFPSVGVTGRILCSHCIYVGSMDPNSDSQACTVGIL